MRKTLPNRAGEICQDTNLLPYLPNFPLPFETLCILKPLYSANLKLIKKGALAL